MPIYWAAARTYDLGEDALRQQAHILGEEAEEQAHEKMGELFGAVAFAGQAAVLFHAVGDADEGVGRGFGDLGLGFVRAQFKGIEKGVAQQVEATAVEDVFEADLVLARGIAGEVGVDLDGVDVAGDEQRRVVQRFAVELQLAVGAFEVFVRSFVFPDEVIAKIDVGESFLAAGFNGLRFEGEVAAAGIVFDGCGVVDQTADVVEVGLGSGRFFEPDLAPLFDEGLGGDGWRHSFVLPV
ncbi:MAG: hypothetical protein R3293_24825 [Candidatus Promineifilaceae bacterium]|nr:hypothetical protein [Candidatus Promineifilaceae bacterium]